MKVFVIPSWYPSEALPSVGIFFKEQAQLLARHRPDWSVGISTWGSHDPRLWISKSRPLEALVKWYSQIPVKGYQKLLEPNCAELFTPAYTWTRRVKAGNMEAILAANEKNLNQFIEHFGMPDLIHAQVSYPGGYNAWKLSQKHDLPFVITEHMSPFPLPSLEPVCDKLLMPPLRHANRVLAVSNHLIQSLESKGVAAHFQSNFIDDQYFIPAEKAVNRNFKLLAVGRLELQKDYPLLLRSVQLLKKEGLRLELRIVGSGGEAGKLKRMTKKLGIEDEVIWLGEKDRDFVREELRNSDVLVSSSHHENQPVSILEAMACGKRIITTNWKGAADLVDEKAGVVCSRDAEALADAMKKEVSRISDFNSIRQHFENRFGTEKCISELEWHFTQAIK